MGGYFGILAMTRLCEIFLQLLVHKTGVLLSAKSDGVQISIFPAHSGDRVFN